VLEDFFPAEIDDQHTLRKIPITG